MLYNHGWEKQQTQRPKGSGSKRVRQARKPTKRNPATVKRTISKAYGGTKIYIRKMKHTNSKQE